MRLCEYNIYRLFDERMILELERACGKSLAVDKVGSRERLPAIAHADGLCHLVGLKQHLVVTNCCSGGMVKPIGAGNLKSEQGSC